MKEIYWINVVKALCMFFVYLLHAEYYWGNNVFRLDIVRPFYVNAFFFISGYLFFKGTTEKFTTIEFVNGLQKVVFRLIIPTILFSTLIYVPKNIFHNTDNLSFLKYLYDVFGGVSYWFTSALVVSQTLLIIMSLIIRNNNLIVFFITSIIISSFICFFIPNNATAFPWNYKAGLGGIILMVIGGIYRKHEKFISKKINSLIMIIIACFYILTFMYLSDLHASITLRGGLNLSGFLIVVLGIFLIICLSKKLPYFNYISFMGKNSIVYYFLSGVYPAFFSTIIGRLFSSSNYLFPIIITLLSLLTSQFSVNIINRHLPWLLDIRVLFKKIR